jgi:hypothetical protein
MVIIARLVAAVSIVLAMSGSAISQDAPRTGPEAVPARGAGDKAAEPGKPKDAGKSEAESNNDAPQANPDGCPYIKRKLELIV